MRLLSFATFRRSYYVVTNKAALKLVNSMFRLLLSAVCQKGRFGLALSYAHRYDQVVHYLASALIQHICSWSCTPNAYSSLAPFLPSFIPHALGLLRCQQWTPDDYYILGLCGFFGPPVKIDRAQLQENSVFSLLNLRIFLKFLYKRAKTESHEPVRVWPKRYRRHHRNS